MVYAISLLVAPEVNKLISWFRARDKSLITFPSAFHLKPARLIVLYLKFNFIFLFKKNSVIPSHYKLCILVLWSPIPGITIIHFEKSLMQIGVISYNFSINKFFPLIQIIALIRRCPTALSISVVCHHHTYRRSHAQSYRAALST